MKCEPGCMRFTGDEARHIKECPFYPESLTKINDDIREQRDRYKEALEFISNLPYGYGDQARSHAKSVLDAERVEGREKK